MTPYAAQHIAQVDQTLFNGIRRAIEGMPDPELGCDEKGDPVVLSCHMLTRAVGTIFRGLKVCDGRYVSSFQHSWLETTRGNIMDVYPVATIGGPLLLDGDPLAPARRIYKECILDSIQDEVFKKPWFLNSLQCIVNVLRQKIE